MGCSPQASTLLGSRLHAIASSGLLNLRLITAESLGDAFLPRLLPLAWKGKRFVTWNPAAPPVGSAIGAGTIKDVWGILAELPDLAALGPWPLVPVHSRTLCQLSALSLVTFNDNITSPCGVLQLAHQAGRSWHAVCNACSRMQSAEARCTQVVEEGSWTEAMGSALSKLSVQVLDSRVLAAAQLGAAGQSLIRPATGAGVLAALSATADGDLGRLGRNFVSAGVSAAEREQLRSFLLQVTPCSSWHSHSQCVCNAHV